MRRRLGILCCVLVLLAGCGYHRLGQGESLGGVSAVKVDLFANHTYQPFLENILTNAVTQRFLRTASWRLVEDDAKADAVFSGTVDDYHSDPISFDAHDNVLEYRAHMKVSGELRRQADGKVLWKGSLTWSDEYPGSLDKGQQADEESAAINSIAERLAEEFYFHLTDNF